MEAGAGAERWEVITGHLEPQHQLGAPPQRGSNSAAMEMSREHLLQDQPQGPDSRSAGLQLLERLGTLGSGRESGHCHSRV